MRAESEPECMCDSSGLRPHIMRSAEGAGCLPLCFFFCCAYLEGAFTGCSLSRSGCQLWPTEGFPATAAAACNVTRSVPTVSHVLVLKGGRF